MSGLTRFARYSFVSLIFAIGVARPTTADADEGDGDDDQVEVDQVSFPIEVLGGSYHIAGYLFHSGPLHDRVLQVTVHGATHYHLYWDLPRIDGISYSYARYMARHGYDVLAIDQLGTGASSQPDGDLVTLDVTANALHQVLASLRTQDNPIHHRFSRVALVGHSNGSLTSIYETGTYHDADVLVTTAWEHTPHPLPFDPADILAVLTAPYIPATTFSEAFWISTFYYVPTTDQALVDYEYSHLGPAVQARAQFLDLFRVGLDTSLSRSTSVTVPVLVQDGNFDALQPSAFLGGEAAFYPLSPSVTLNFLVDVGHNINGHRNHLQSWTRIDEWIERSLGESSPRGGDEDGQ
jgi:pimeloyl-ACP methyl ester carboxylesterase